LRAVRAPVDRYRITAYDRGLVPNRFLAFLDDGVVDQCDWLARSGRSIGHPGWGWVYHTVLMLLDADRHNVVVETGTNVGSTAIVIAQAIIDSGRPGELHTIELEQEIHEEARRRFELAGVADVITAHRGDSRELLPRIVAEHDELAVVFLDGNHFHDCVVAEFEDVVAKVRSDGAIIFDNTRLIAEGSEDPRVHGALRTIVSRHGGNLVSLPFCSWYTPGMAIWQRQAFTDMAPPEAGTFTPNS
jgi:Methyltransferase domain